MPQKLTKKCIDCFVLITKTKYTRCLKCFFKKIEHIPKKCADCDIRITRWDAKRCRKCDGLSKRIPIEVRFFKYVKKSKGCWSWKGAKHKFGYGKFAHEDAHRTSWKIHNGPIPKGLYVLHKCPKKHSPGCCNPKHLYLGTQKQNVHDAIKQGTFWTTSGEQRENAVLTWKKVKQIRRIYRFGKYGFGSHKLSQMFGVSPVTILKIVNNKKWVIE